MDSQQWILDKITENAIKDGPTDEKVSGEQSDETTGPHAQ
jgi:hypothetical protein